MFGRFMRGSGGPERDGRPLGPPGRSNCVRLAGDGRPRLGRPWHPGKRNRKRDPNTRRRSEPLDPRAPREALPQEGDRVVTMTEAARESGCSAEHLRRLARRGSRPTRGVKMFETFFCRTKARTLNVGNGSSAPRGTVPPDPSEADLQGRSGSTGSAGSTRSALGRSSYVLKFL